MNIRHMFCNHRKHGREEIIHGAFEDEPNGPRTMQYISWQCRGCGHVIGDPLDRNDRAPELTAEMKRRGLAWRRVGEDWRMVCDLCLGNCGQCGTSVGMGIPASLDAIIEPVRGLPFHGFRR